MNHTYLVKYKNNSKVLVSVTNKCGSSTCITILGFPFLGEFRYRDDRKKIVASGHWREKSIKTVTQSELTEYTTKIAIVRDPVERFVSCYKDRVLARNKDNLRKTITDINEFIENIDRIKLQSMDIRSHTKPLYEVYGKHPEIYTHFINTDNIDTEFLPLIETISETSPIPSARWKNSSAIKDIELTNDQIKKIKEMYKTDYEIYGRYF